MIRKIVDYQKLNEELLNLLIEKFPDGYGDNDIITFKNAKGEVIEAVEIKTEDTIYLVKIGVKLVKVMEEHTEEDKDDYTDVDNETEITDIEDTSVDDDLD